VRPALDRRHDLLERGALGRQLVLDADRRARIDAADDDSLRLELLQALRQRTVGDAG
jgi:hypothetical protein